MADIEPRTRCGHCGMHSATARSRCRGCGRMTREGWAEYAASLWWVVVAVLLLLALPWWLPALERLHSR